MKKFLTTVGAGLASVASFAEGGSTIATSEDILTAGKTALEGLLTTALPIIGALVVTGLTLWGVFRLIGLVKRAFGFGSSR